MMYIHPRNESDGLALPTFKCDRYPQRIHLRYFCSFVLMVVLTYPLFGQRPTVIYTSQNGRTMTLVPWAGRKVVVLTQAANRDPHIMQTLVGALDSAYRVYEQMTGSDPGPNAQGALNGLDIVAEVPDDNTACGGAACSYLGIFGSEIGETYFNELYDGIRVHGQYDQAMFYELGRTFWFYHDQLGKLDSFVTGFAIANRFISMDRANLEGGPLGKLPYSDLKKSILVDLLQSYLSDPNFSWRNTLPLDKSVPNEHGWGAADLAGAMIYRIYADFGFRIYQAFWHDLAKQPRAESPDDVIRNFLAAAKLATGKDYGFLFKDTSHLLNCIR
jgi:serralysin